MPGLIDESGGIVAGVRHRIAEPPGVRGEPPKGFRILERLSQGPRARRGDVDRAARVMLAESGRGIDGENLTK